MSELTRALKRKDRVDGQIQLYSQKTGQSACPNCELMGCRDARNLWGSRGRRRFCGSGRRRVGRSRRIKNRLLVAPPERKEIESDASQEEERREDRGCARQRISGTSWREQAAKTGSTSAHAERTALGPLQQDEYDEGGRNEDFREDQ